MARASQREREQRGPPCHALSANSDKRTDGAPLGQGVQRSAVRSTKGDFASLTRPLLSGRHCDSAHHRDARLSAIMSQSANTSSTGRPAPPAPPSHAAFILSQVRTGLAHLRATTALDRTTFNQVDDLLTKAVLQNRTQHGDGQLRGAETEEERLGKRNAWLREALSETSLLPTLVETAMSIAVPSPLMSDMQREAVVQLVERSQKSIAEAITNPKMQKRATGGAFSSAKGAHSGIVRGFNVAGQSWQEMSQRRQEAKQRSEQKKAERKEKQALKKELKQERDAITRQRQANMLGNAQASGSAGPAPSAQASEQRGGMDRVTSSAALVHSPSTLTASTDSSAPSLRHAPPPAFSHRHGASQIGSSSGEEEGSDDDERDAFHAEDGAMAAVSCGRVDDDENCVTATTTFSPWPGLLLSTTMVAISDEDISAPIDIDRVRFLQASQRSNNASTQSAPPQRRVAPPPAAFTEASDQQRAVTTPNTKVETAPEQSSEQVQGATGTLSTHQSQPLQQQRELPSTPPSTFASSQPRSESTASTHPDSHRAQPRPPPPPPHAHQVSSPPVREPRQAYSSGSVDHAPQTAAPPQPQRTEVRDVTDSKQKSWTRKLGL